MSKRELRMYKTFQAEQAMVKLEAPKNDSFIVHATIVTVVLGFITLAMVSIHSKSQLAVDVDRSIASYVQN